jgi:hypothetical protein
VVENFSEGADAEGEDGQRAHKHEELTVALLRGVSAKELPGGGIVGGGPQRVVSGADLLALTGDVAATISDAVLERLAANRRTVGDALDAQETAELAAELGRDVALRRMGAVDECARARKQGGSMPYRVLMPVPLPHGKN